MRGAKGVWHKGSRRPRHQHRIGEAYNGLGVVGKLRAFSSLTIQSRITIACKFDAVADLKEFQVRSRQFYRMIASESDLSFRSAIFWSLRIDYYKVATQPLNSTTV